MKKSIKDISFLVLVFMISTLNIYSQSESKQIQTIKLKEDSLIISNENKSQIERNIQKSLPTYLNPKVDLSKTTEGDSNGDGEVEVTTRTINMSVDIAEIAINRFIATQNFPPVSGTFPNTNITYTAWISRPFVTLRANHFRANFTIYVQTSEPAFYVIPVNPDLRLDPAFVTLSEVRAWLENFPALINSLNIPQMIKDMIIQQYNNLNVIIYPNRLLDMANNLIPQYLNIWITDMGGGYAISNRALRLNFSITVNAEPPFFAFQSLTVPEGLFQFKGHSNVKTILHEVRLYGLNGKEWQHVYDIDIEKDTWSGVVNTGQYLSYSVYFFYAYFRSPYGEYIRKFEFSNSSQWEYMGYLGGIN